MAYAMAPREVISSMMLIHQYSMLCAPIMGQIGAIEALRNGTHEMERMVRDYDRRRHLIVNGLNKIGLECFEPSGAFYAFPSVQNTGLTSEEFAEKLLFEQKVVTIPGNVFGKAGDGFLRCSYATSREEIEEALARIEAFVDGL
jgi:aminotransferase